MKRLLTALLVSSAIAFPALAALKQGDQAPDFAAPASLAGKEFRFSLQSALKQGPVVVYYYPSAFTGGCNIEAHTFAVNQETDPDSKIAKSFDLRITEGKPGFKDTRGAEIDHAFTERTTFVITPDGKIVATFSSADDKITPIDHVTKSLATVTAMHKP